MPDVDWVFFDTAIFTTGPAGQIQLFQIPQGGDSVHVEDFTNSIGSGSLPANMSFLIKAIAMYAELDIVEIEIKKVLARSYLEIVVADKVMLKAPLIYFAAPQGYAGYNNVTPAANLMAVSYVGPLFELVIPIPIPGGTPFKINVTQIVATAADEQVKLLMIGTLTRP